ncbi:MAG: hypothetical protein A2V88_13680 [Elusimicrobia bacterium RBG_16_66_12]|nr:MAG: hypothetical protein A2V88_13680 [Elusimicrobia bacterium RBG_16_66_12]
MSTIPYASRSFFGFFSSVLIARGLGPVGMGQYALVMSVSDGVTVLSDLGVGQTALRYGSLAASRKDVASHLAVLRWAFGVRMTLTLLLVTVLFLLAPILTAWCWHAGGLAGALRVGLLVAVFSAAAAVPSLYFQSLKRFGMNALVLTVQGFVALAGVGVLAILRAWSVPAVVGMAALATGIGALLFLHLIPRGAIYSRTPDPGGRKPGGRVPWQLSLPEELEVTNLDTTSANRFTLYLLLSTLIVMITMRLDVWLMGYFTDQAQIGLYSIATRAALPLVFLLGGLNTALWPRASSLTSLAEFRNLVRKTLKASVVVAMMGGVYAIIVPFVVTLLFGSQYHASGGLARIIVFGYCVACLANPIGVVGYSIGLARVYWIVNLFQMALVVAMLVLLLPHYGALGAAWAFLINTLSGGLINGMLVWRRSRRWSGRIGDDTRSLRGF